MEIGKIKVKRPVNGIYNPQQYHAESPGNYTMSCTLVLVQSATILEILIGSTSLSAHKNQSQQMPRGEVTDAPVLSMGWECGKQILHHGPISCIMQLVLLLVVSAVTGLHCSRIENVPTGAHAAVCFCTNKNLSFGDILEQMGSPHANVINQ